MTFQEYKNLVHAPKAAKMASDKWYSGERHVSAALSWSLLKMFPRITPNTVTAFSFLILLATGVISFYVPASSSVFTLQLFLLYCITITDKMDGEIARAKNINTQKGIYYDYTVHLFYPFIFYLVVARYFYSLFPNDLLFYLTISLGFVTLILISFRATVLLVGETIKTKNLSVNDWIESKRKKLIWFWPMRILDYLTFMIYAWTLVFYLLLAVLGIWYPYLAYLLYAIHTICTLLVLLYRLLWSYPRRKLLVKEN